MKVFISSPIERAWARDAGRGASALRHEGEAVRRRRCQRASL